MKLRPLYKHIYLFFIFAILAVWTGANAQTLGGQPDPVQFTVSPEVPGANQTVIIQAQGVGTFLGNADISWKKDGVTALSGAGERTFSFTTGGLGVATRVRVVIDSSSQGTIVRDFTFIPSVVNLLWEADTSVPLLYRGHTHYSAGSAVTVTAFPTIIANGTTISSNNLSFEWQRNGDTIPESSGKGRSSLTFTGSQLLRAEAVSVDVYLSDVKVGSAQITIPAEDPLLILYPRDPLRGILYNQALPSGIALGSNELTLVAEPYFFSTESVANGAATYTWTLNGKAATGPDAAQGVLTLRQTGSGTGSAVLGVTLQNSDPSKFVQSASAALQIVFGEQTGSAVGSFFGL